MGSAQSGCCCVLRGYTGCRNAAAWRGYAWIGSWVGRGDPLKSLCHRLMSENYLVIWTVSRLFLWGENAKDLYISESFVDSSIHQNIFFLTLKNLFIYFNWGTITSQHCGGPCHTSPPISHGGTCGPQSWIPLHLPPHPISLGCPRAPVLSCPASCIELALVICYTYGNIHVSMLFSHIIPPSLSPTEFSSLFFTSVSLLLPCI